MINAKPFMDKINEIEKRMDYVIKNWESDERITLQEKRFILSAYIHSLYKNKKVEDLAKGYLLRIKEKRRLDVENILTAMASALIVGEDFSECWNKLKERIDRSSPTEKSNLIVQFLIILTPNTLRKVDDVQYIKTLLNNLKNQNTERKLFSYWIEKCLFSDEEKITISQDEIKHLREYLLWELINSEDKEHQKEELREKFIPEVLNYKVDRVDWIAFLMYQFLKKNKPIVVTEIELNRKIKHEVKVAISKKVWFPLIFSILFVLVKLYLVNGITKETIGQVLILILGTLFLFFEERLPSFEIPVKRYKISFGQIGELLIIIPILWVLGLISFIKEVFP